MVPGGFHDARALETVSCHPWSGTQIRGCKNKCDKAHVCCSYLKLSLWSVKVKAGEGLQKRRREKRGGRWRQARTWSWSDEMKMNSRRMKLPLKHSSIWLASSQTLSFLLLKCRITILYLFWSLNDNFVWFFDCQVTILYAFWSLNDNFVCVLMAEWQFCICFDGQITIMYRFWSCCCSQFAGNWGNCETTDLAKQALTKSSPYSSFPKFLCNVQTFILFSLGLRTLISRAIPFICTI